VTPIEGARNSYRGLGTPFKLGEGVTYHFMFLVGVLDNVYTNAPELRHSTSLTRFDTRSLAAASYPITRVTDLNCDREHLHIYIGKDAAEFIFRNWLYRDVVWREQIQ